MKVPAKPEYVGVVRLTVSGIANRLGYAYDDIEDIKIAIAEACTNVVDHAYETEGMIYISFRISPESLEVMVADNGQSFNMDNMNGKFAPLDTTKPISELKEGGLGLFLINTLMDKVQFNNDSGVVLVMTKFLQRNGVAEHVNERNESTQEQG